MKTFRLLSALLFCFVSFLFSGSFLQDNDKVSIEIEYEGHSVYWSDDEFLGDTQLFDFSGQAQRNSRLKDNKARFNLCNKLLKMGFSLDETMEYCFKGLTKKINDFCKKIDKNPVDATLKFLPNTISCFTLTRESEGLRVDKAKLYQGILEQLNNANTIKTNIKPEVLKPNVYYSELKELTSLKSSFSTNYAQSSENRKHNIKKALSCFNGLTLEPYEECSFNSKTKRRNEQNGYKPANVIVNEEYVEGFGGGVCQVSTTLYNALLLAGVQILESHPHSLKSSYVLDGFDAMVNYGSSDLRFKNNFQTPIFIKAYATNSNIIVNIYGKVENNYTIKRSNKIVREIEPKKERVIVDVEGKYADKVYYTDQSYVKMHSKRGAEVYSYLEIWDKEKLLEKKLIRKQTYKAVDGIIIVGAHKREEETQPAELDDLLT